MIFHDNNIYLQLSDWHSIGILNPDSSIRHANAGNRRTNYKGIVRVKINGETCYEYSSLGEGLKSRFNHLLNEVKEDFNKGGAPKGNKNAVKVGDLERLALLNLAINFFERKPYAEHLKNMYDRVRNAGGQIINKETGEVIDGAQLKELSLRTIERYIGKGGALYLPLDKHFMSDLEFRDKHLPHVHRSKPSFAFAKCSMDDKVFRLSITGGVQLWSYLIFDVYSGAIVGYSLAPDTKDGSGKTLPLMKAALLDMLTKWGRVPEEIETEQHLASTLKGGLLKSGELFPRVRFALGGNPQEKHAERFIRNFKYQFEALEEGFKARPFSKRLSNRINQDAKQKVYTVEDAKATAERLINEYNADKNRLKKFKESLQNSDLKAPEAVKVAQYLGQSKTVQVKKHQYFDAFAERWLMPADMKWLEGFVTGEPITASRYQDEIYIFQQGNYLGKATLLDEAQQVAAAQVEWKKKDGENIHKHNKMREGLDEHAKSKIKDADTLEVIVPSNLKEISTARKELFDPGEDHQLKIVG